MTSNLRQIPLTCSGHTRPVVHLDFSDICESGYYLISACKDGSPMLRQGDTGDWVGTFEGHKGAVWGVALNKNATLAATGAADFTGKVWNAVTGAEIHSFQHKHIVKTVAFDKCSENIVTGSSEKFVRVFNLEQPNMEPEIYAGHSGTIKRALFCRDDKCIVSAAEDKTVRLWDRLTGNEIQRLQFTHNPNSLEISADNHILTITHGGSISFWEVDTLKKLKEIKVPTNVSSASLHPDKHVFVCGGEDFKMYKFDYITGNEIESFKGHFGPVHSVKFSPDGELYASGSEDGTLRLWQTTVGKTYGLWKCTEPGELNNSLNSPREVHAN
ncbi:serine-threonine kinase receptor-associated protein-like [Teleopsis dalmanni]|uniref:serine-threonine kinase receptor-associated protein-like n=1 Tax=Teleopsis dalmanni TaxID=139649 RepID=UPI0018CDC1FA|nr:serine-threonine kinase receptor-associated protein-like [Teleopsis dalmanni]XP_037956966.1 serine-threonine kinase receptor-associated protein-like [Teleopsis dalmanni]